MSRERMIFDPDSIEIALKLNPADALRALADAIDAGEIDVTVVSAVGHGFSKRDDDRIHVLARIGLAAQCEIGGHMPAMISLPALTATPNKALGIDEADLSDPLLRLAVGEALILGESVDEYQRKLTRMATRVESAYNTLAKMREMFIPGTQDGLIAMAETELAALRKEP